MILKFVSFAAAAAIIFCEPAAHAQTTAPASDDAVSAPWSHVKSCPTGEGRQLEAICADESGGSSFDDERGFQMERSSETTHDGFDVCAALESARAGDAAEALRVAGALRRGIGLSRDMCAAAHWASRAARGGDARAMTVLGAHFELGQGVPSNPERARFWYERASSKGDLRALTRLGALYRDGLGVPSDLKKAEGYFRRAADGGDPAGMMALADIHVRGEKKQIDVARALELSGAAAKSGHAPAMAQHAALQIWGALLNRKKKSIGDCEDGVVWAQRADQAKIALGASLIGDAHLIGCGLAKSRVEAERWYARAVERGASVSPKLATILRGEEMGPVLPMDPLPADPMPLATVSAGEAATRPVADQLAQGGAKPRRAARPRSSTERSPPRRATMALELRKPKRKPAANESAIEASRSAEAEADQALLFDDAAGGSDAPQLRAEAAEAPDIGAETARRAALVSFALGRQNGMEPTVAAKDPAAVDPEAPSDAATAQESDHREGSAGNDKIQARSAVSDFNELDLR